MGIKKVFERRVYLWLNASMQILNAAGVTTIRDLLSKATPLSDPTKILKCKVCQIMVDVWAVLQVVVANVRIGKDVSHNLQQYLDLMMRVEAMMRRKSARQTRLTRMPSPSSSLARPWTDVPHRSGNKAFALILDVHQVWSFPCLQATL